MFDDYLAKKDGNRRVVIDHYMQNKVDKFLIVYLIKTGKLSLTDNDRAYMPYVVQQFREISEKVNEINGFLRKAVKLI
jgi:uncharacterized membrane protein YdfJ with MMPL/SSD domain